MKGYKTGCYIDTCRFVNIFEHLFSLKGKKDRVIFLCFLSGMTQEESASLLDCSQQYIQKRLKKIKSGCNFL